MIDRIKDIVNHKLLTEDQKKHLIFSVIGEDDDAINHVMCIVQSRLKQDKDTILGLNLMLSKADVVIEDPKMNKDGFVEKEIEEFYLTHQNLTHCFNKYNS